MDKITSFLEGGYGHGDGNGNGYGYGYGDGDCHGNGNGDGNGNGHGYGYGDGNGYGNGYGHGDGNGNGDGYGYGNGYGIKEIEGFQVHIIDQVPTIIETVRGRFVRGYIIRDNVRLIPCFVAQVGGFFGHGDTLRKAVEAATDKYNENRPLSERISAVLRKYPSPDKPIHHRILFGMHHTLTGSCEFGRREFCLSHGLDPDDGMMTMREFINLTKNAYGKEAIHQLAEAYGINL